MKRISGLVCIVILLMSCGEDTKDNAVQPAPSVNVVIAKNVNSPGAGVDGSGRPLPGEHPIFFNFKENKTLTYTDSASTKWDIGFSATTIIINSAASGPGNASGMVYTGIFDNMSEAPATGYKTDTNEEKAIKIGSGNGWYNYNVITHVVLPIPGRILVFRTADGNYVKMEILSYYQDAPVNPTSADPSGYYTFRYVYQPDGTKKF